LAAPEVEFGLPTGCYLSLREGWLGGENFRMSGAELGEILFEFRQVGNVVKVSAIHVDTDTEVCLVGPPAAGEHGLKMAAIRKLIYVLGRREG
jgi:hypothetical protein